MIGTLSAALLAIALTPAAAHAAPDLLAASAPSVFVNCSSGTVASAGSTHYTTTSGSGSAQHGYTKTSNGATWGRTWSWPASQPGNHKVASYSSFNGQVRIGISTNGTATIGATNYGCTS